MLRVSEQLNMQSSSQQETIWCWEIARAAGEAEEIKESGLGCSLGVESAEGDRIHALNDLFWRHVIREAIERCFALAVEF